ncbi:PP0621 family protein [Caldimonas tepidiphila]|uniref:PP0621 family protein n=1 Tax=Caldimonas tepidiphila TaxID=2315841 RepID=UPI000E5C2326|nr:PP0621 family protein [Caldimonas tepidiphila]
MTKVLILLAVIALLWWLLRPRPGRGGADAGAAPQARDASPREIVACARCGVHVPRDEALPGPAGEPYCCEAHRGAGPPR